jgi:arsenate reductase-like glutaredoxin family protein
MSKMSKFMMVHNNPGINCEEIQANWRKLAQVETATWIRTYYNDEKGIRFCIWLAPSEEDLKNIFTEIGISWESIIPVEETVPDLWGEKWDEHLEKDAKADTLAN